MTGGPGGHYPTYSESCFSPQGIGHGRGRAVSLPSLWPGGSLRPPHVQLPVPTPVGSPGQSLATPRHCPAHPPFLEALPRPLLQEAFPTVGPITATFCQSVSLGYPSSSSS